MLLSLAGPPVGTFFDFTYSQLLGQGYVLESLISVPPPQGKLVVQQLGVGFTRAHSGMVFLYLSRSRYTTFLDQLNLIIYQSLSLGWIFTVFGELCQGSALDFLTVTR